MVTSFKKLCTRDLSFVSLDIHSSVYLMIFQLVHLL